MLNEDYRDMLRILSEEKVDFLPLFCRTPENPVFFTEV